MRNAFLSYHLWKLLAALSFFLGFTVGWGEEKSRPAELETIQVTGFRLPPLLDSPEVLLIRIDQEDIETSGAFDLQDLLRTLPQNGVHYNDNQIFGFTPGASALNLRGAGVQYTLSLINGRRAAPYGIGAGSNLPFFNLQTLPLAAIESIEILPSGASALYGSDAVAGVVNYILKKDFRGVEAQVGYQNTAEEDAGFFNFNATAGYSKESWQMLVVVDYSSQNAQFRRDRDWGDSSDGTDRDSLNWLNFSAASGYPSAYVVGTSGDFATSPDPYTTGDLLSFGSGSEQYAALETDPNDRASHFPEWESWSAFGAFTRQISPTSELSLDFGYNFRDGLNVLHPLALSSQTDFPGVTGVGVDNPYNPFGVNRTDGGTPENVNIRWRLRDAGNRTHDFEDETWRVAGDWKSEITPGWQLNVGGQWMRGDVFFTRGGFLDRQATLEALNASDPQEALNVWGGFSGAPQADNNAAILPGLVAVPRQEASSEMLLADILLQGTLRELKAGPLRLLVGGEWRDEQFAESSDAASAAGEIIQINGRNNSGDREVLSTFAEISLPLTPSLELKAAGRFEDYSDFGQTVNPKISLGFRPLRNLFFRASYSEGFRAPGLVQLFQGQNEVFDGTPRFDPYRQVDLDNDGVAETNAPVDNAIILQGGNPNLREELSETMDLGIQWQAGDRFLGGALEGFFASVNWFRLDIEDQIATLGVQEALDAFGLDPTVVFRAPPGAQDQDLNQPGEVLRVANSFVNLGKTEIRAVDTGLGFRRGSVETGQLDISLNTSWLYSFRRDFDPTSSDTVGLEEFRGTDSVPEWRGNLNLDWRKGAWFVGVGGNYVGSYDQTFQDFVGFFGITRPMVEDQLTWDLRVGLNSFFGNDLKFGVRNLFDEDPPLYHGDRAFYDAANHDPRGRMYWVSLERAW